MSGPRRHGGHSALAVRWFTRAHRPALSYAVTTGRLQTAASFGQNGKLAGHASRGSKYRPQGRPGSSVQVLQTACCHATGFITFHLQYYSKFDIFTPEAHDTSDD